MQCRAFLRSIALGIVMSMTIPSAFAATITSNLRNTTGAPLAGVVVTLTTQDGTKVASATTDAAGRAIFSDVAAGDYVVTATGTVTAEVRKSVQVAQQDATSVELVMDTARALGTVNVTATRLREARIALSPKVGTTIYSLDEQFIDNLPAGADTPFNDVLLHLPGVAQDSKASGSLHIRDEHANVQYRINGVQLPEGITGFGQSVDTRFADKIDFLTGALPAQYGLRTAGIVEIETKDGAFQSGGKIGVFGGGYDTIQPSVEFSGAKDGFSYYATGTYLSNSLGIENPTPARDAIHDRTQQGKGFGYFSYTLDDQTRVALMLGSYNGKFQIPNNPGQDCAFSLAGVCDVDNGVNTLPSAQLNENQREQNQYGVVAFQRTIGKFDYQASFFYQYSKVHYTPDPNGGDLIYLGVSSDTLRSNSAAGLQFDASYRYNADHTPRFGAAYMHQFTRSDNTVGVFPTDDMGTPTSNIPEYIVDNSSKTGNLTSFYVQDEWRLAPAFTLNYGLRFDHVAAFTNEQQWSPRVNALWRVTTDTSVHAAYARYFTPPPQELVSQESINLFANTTNAPEIPVSDTVKAERTNYFDVGITHIFAPGLTIGLDAYYKDIKNLLDEGQFGQALILTPFNYANGYAEGVELSATYNSGPWSAYANFAVAKAKGKNIISGQSLFGVDELAYIADHFIYLDHDQRYSLTMGATRRFGTVRAGADLIYGSGLRNTPDGAPPNSGKLASYAQVNLALTNQWAETALGTLEGRLAIINLFDRVYLLRDGSGVGVGAPQYAQRRTFYAGLSARF